MPQYLVTGSFTLSYLVDADSQPEAIKKVIDRDNITILPKFSVTEYTVAETEEEHETPRPN